MVGSNLKGPGYHTQLPEGTRAHATRESLDYALALLAQGESPGRERAVEILRKVLSLQDTDPASQTYGIWPWYLEEPLSAMAPPDWNWADFCGARLAEALARHGAELPGDVTAEIRAGLGHAAWSIFRRNVGPDYTNIAIMGAGVVLAAGEMLDEARLRLYGRRRLERMVAHAEHHTGFTEYNSPTYTMTALEECERILHLVKDAPSRLAAGKLRRLCWTTIADHFHPATRQWAGPHSRAYADRLDEERIRYVTTFCPDDLSPRFRHLPAPVVELRQTLIRQNDGMDDVQGITWLTEEACLGSANYETLWTQRRPLLGYWKGGGDVAVLRLRFLRDGKDFASACVYNAQQGCRVLSAVGMLTDGGDFHLFLDAPADGLFTASDFRVRYELTAAGATASALGRGRFRLAAADYEAVIHTLPSWFGTQQVLWQLTEHDGRVTLDGICHSGPNQTFRFEDLGDIVLAGGMEVLPRGAHPVETTPTVERSSSDELRIRWMVGEGLCLNVPAQPIPRCRFGQASPRRLEMTRLQTKKSPHTTT
jgi:hypothetical protein